MELYVEGVLEKVDYCAEKYVSYFPFFRLEYIFSSWDWDEMMREHAKDYDKLQPILRWAIIRFINVDNYANNNSREKFRIIDRELIKEDGTQEVSSQNSR